MLQAGSTESQLSACVSWAPSEAISLMLRAGRPLGAPCRALRLLVSLRRDVLLPLWHPETIGALKQHVMLLDMLLNLGPHEINDAIGAWLHNRTTYWAQHQ